MPNEALSYEKDEYLRKSIRGRVFLAYETYDTTYGSQKNASTKFQQTYSLDMKGNLLSRNIIIYDAGATWNLDDYNTNSSTTNSKATRYYARTTILPRSAIPLTLHWSTDTSFSSMSKNQSASKVYGLDWSARFRTLPTTRISAETAENNSVTILNKTNRYSLDMEKELGPTKNYLNFKEQDTHSTPSGDSTNQYTLNINNKTKIGRGTDLTAGITKSEARGTATSTNSTVQNSTLQGISLLLNSKPSDEFAQTHQYNFFSNKNGGNTNEGNTYTGSLIYNIGRAFSSNISLNVDNSRADSQTSRTKNNNLASKADVRLALTTHWFLSQHITIDNRTTNSNTPAVNLDNHSIFKSLTALNYSRPLRWVKLSGHYGAGYTKESYTLPPSSGKGLTQDAGVAMNNIDVTKYAGFDTSAKFRRVENSADHKNSSSKSYNLSGFNKAGRKYAAVSSSYTKAFNKSWNRLYDTSTKSYNLTANSNYFRYTSLGYTMANSSKFDSINGISKKSSKNFSLGYKRPLLSGSFTSALTYGVSNSTTRGIVIATNAKSAAVGYGRKVFDGTLSTSFDYSSSHSVENATYTADEFNRVVSLNFSGNVIDINKKHATIAYGRTIFRGTFSSTFDYSSKHETYRFTFRDESNQKVGLRYARKVFSGNLLVLYNTSTQNVATLRQEYLIKDTDYSAQYSAMLFRRLSWRAYYKKEMRDTDINSNFRHVTYYSNNFAYQLRNWSLTAEQSYRLTQSQEGRDSTEAKMLFTAERTFFRVF
ncbi:MAG: hypothetical protein HZB82_01985 [Deltaproteobacteria bacterium]|nr:hypothetical protein [Deltaproteobacteria bacterium]